MVRRDLYERVRDLMSEGEFEARVAGKVEEWGGLIDPDVACQLVLDEAGRLEPPFHRIADLQEGAEVTLRCTVEAISPIREFERSDGTPGRVVNLDVRDDSGRCRIVLWDDDVQLVERGRIVPGTVLRTVDCYVRQTKFGLEVSRGRFGTVVIEG
jgi:replication factor A1